LDKKKIIEEGKRVLQEEIISLQAASEKLGSDFARAVELVAEANKVIVSGIGKSGIIAKKIAATFSSIGLTSVFLHPVEALHGDIGVVASGDVVILLSKSGSTDEIVRLVPYLKARSVKIISITGNGKSFLFSNSDIALNGSVEREACPLNIAPMSSTIVAMAIGDAMAACIMKIKKLEMIDFSRQHPLGQIGRNLLLQVKDVMHTGEMLPKVFSGAAFRDAIIEITQKGLGCVCIVSRKNELKGIITDGDVRRALQRFEDIRQLKVEDIMTIKPLSVKPEFQLGEALSYMENRTSQIMVLPVVDDKNVCMGVIRLHDIVRSGI
jgi:arabinose-5-phosphate isomerase